VHFRFSDGRRGGEECGYGAVVGVVGADGPSLYPCEASHREPPDKALSHSFFWEISGFFFR
jgi:hypothetical protein